MSGTTPPVRLYKLLPRLTFSTKLGVGCKQGANYAVFWRSVTFDGGGIIARLLNWSPGDENVLTEGVIWRAGALKWTFACFVANLIDSVFQLFRRSDPAMCLRVSGNMEDRNKTRINTLFIHY